MFAHFLTQLRPGAVTVAKTYRLLRTILTAAVDDGLIVRNPCVINGAGVEAGAARNGQSPRSNRSTRLPTRWSPATECSCCWPPSPPSASVSPPPSPGSIDLQTGRVTVTQSASELNDGTRIVDEPKTQAGRRTVAVPGVLLEELRGHLETYAQSGRDGVVFVGPHGAPLRRSNWSNSWRRTVTALELEHLRFHDLRHTGNTLAAATGASTKELMTRMGHSSSRAALIYQHASVDREPAIAQRLSEMMSAARE